MWPVRFLAACQMLFLFFFFICVLFISIGTIQQLFLVINST